MESQRVQSQGSKPSRYAVLVGCNYPNTDYQLGGCVHDVWRLHKTLLDRFGFVEANINVLIDTESYYTQLTSDNIKQALQNMITNSSPGDVLLFHFSGHGTRIERADDESGYDEAIVPCDYKLNKDDFFRELVNSLPSKTSLTVISDSCHSAGLIDKEKEQIGPHALGTTVGNPYRRHSPRFIKPEDIVHLLTTTGGMTQTEATTLVMSPIVKSNVHPDMGILLSGCQSDELSYDTSSDPSQAFGAFSDALQQVFGKHLDPISNKDLLKQARSILAQNKSLQHPCLYCSDDNATAPFLHQGQ